MSAAAKHSFWHVRLWEFIFLMIVGPLLLRKALLPGQEGSTALMVSVLVFVIKLDTLRTPPAEQAYPSEFRWPCIGSFTSIAVGVWQLDAKVGTDSHILGVTAGFVCIGALVLLEVFSWRKAHKAPREGGAHLPAPSP